MLLRTFLHLSNKPLLVKNITYIFINRSKSRGSHVKPTLTKVLAASTASVTKLQQLENGISRKPKSETTLLHKENISKEEIQEEECQTKRPDVTATVVERKISISDSDKNVKLLNTVKPDDLEWHKEKSIDLKLLPKYYKSLAKIRLSGLVVITTLAGYGMAPGAFDPTALVFMVLGTGLTSAAANSINQILEVPYDSQMTRTKQRVLVRGVISPLHASMFALTSASLGVGLLYCGTNSLTAFLGATNLLLYTCVYTPMKRYSIANTWLGSVVGAIPPLMGWAAATGSLNSGALLLAAILYSWQFPHFNALSWNLRPDYSRAGYRMTSVINPQLCQAVALRHSVALLVLCSTAPLLHLTTWTFAFDSLPLNCLMVYRAWQFKQHGDAQTSRKLFRLSLLYLPVVFFLMLLGKEYPAKKETDVSSSS